MTVTALLNDTNRTLEPMVTDSNGDYSINIMPYDIASVEYNSIGESSRAGDLERQYFTEEYILFQNVSDYNDILYSTNTSFDTQTNIDAGYTTIIVDEVYDIIEEDAEQYISKTKYNVNGNDTLYKTFNVNNTIESGETLPSFTIETLLPSINSYNQLKIGCGAESEYDNYTVDAGILTVNVPETLHNNVTCYNSTYYDSLFTGNYEIAYNDNSMTYFLDDFEYGAYIDEHPVHMSNKSVDVVWNIPYTDLNKWELKDSYSANVYGFDGADYNSYTLFRYSTNDNAASEEMEMEFETDADYTSYYYDLSWTGSGEEFAPDTGVLSTIKDYVNNTKSLTYAAFGLVALIIIVVAGMAIVNIASNGGDTESIMKMSIWVIGFAILLFIGYLIISAVSGAVIV